MMNPMSLVQNISNKGGMMKRSHARRIKVRRGFTLIEILLSWPFSGGGGAVVLTP